MKYLLLCLHIHINLFADTSVVVSNKDDTVKNKIVNKVQKKGASRPADKINGFYIHSIHYLYVAELN